MASLKNHVDRQRLLRAGTPYLLVRRRDPNDFVEHAFSHEDTARAYLLSCSGLFFHDLTRPQSDDEPNPAEIADARAQASLPRP